jgi:hypothetical protein
VINKKYPIKGEYPIDKLKRKQATHWRVRLTTS